jgi:hypothetical protein
MPAFNLFSPKSGPPVIRGSVDVSPPGIAVFTGSVPSEHAMHSGEEEIILPEPTVSTSSSSTSTGTRLQEITTSPPLNLGSPKSKPTRRFSFKSFAILSRSHSKHILSRDAEHEKIHAAASSLEHRRKADLPKTKAEKRAYYDALAVRSLIIGPSSPPQVNKAVAKPQISQMKSLKSQLMKPSSANRVISQLRSLPVIDAPEQTTHSNYAAPIHAVCLTVTERDADTNHFAQLTSPENRRSVGAKDNKPPSTTSVDALMNAFNELSIVDLVQSPGFGLGNPGDGDGILAGAVPTAETVINGFKQITPQLMALGFATGQAIVPNHTGIYPPTDRISVLTYWWGLELCLPPPTLEYLSTVKSISNAAVNFLTALSMINQGVREIVPFVRYISQYLDFEFGVIQKQNQGRGVVCAATWIMPAAMIPRPWDFPVPPDEVSGTKRVEEASNGSSDPTLISPLSPPEAAQVGQLSGSAK